MVNEYREGRGGRTIGRVGENVGLSYSWSCCTEGRRFEFRPWNYSMGSSSSNQATGKVFSAEYAIYCKL